MLAGNATHALWQWAVLAVLARLTTTQVVGRYAFALAVVTPVVTFANLQLRGVLVTDATARFPFARYLHVRLATSAAAAGALLLLAPFVAPAGTRLLFVLVGLWKAIDAVADLLYGRLQRHERMDPIARSLMLKAVVSLAAFAATLELTGRPGLAVAALALTRGVLLLLYDLPASRGVAAGEAAGAAAAGAGRLVRIGLPLGLVMLLATLNASLPRYFLLAAHGADALGVFAAVASLPLAGTMVIGALGQTASPRLARHFAERRAAAFGRLALALTALAVLSGAAGTGLAALAGSRVLALAFGPEYAAHGGLLVRLALTYTLGYVASLGGFCMTAAREFDAQLPLFAVVVGVSAAACRLWVPAHGAEGAAAALALGFLVQAVGSTVVVARAFRRPVRA